MGVKEIGFVWTCDWCGKNIKSPESELPAGWIEPDDNAYFKLELEHICSDDCWKVSREADLLAHELAKEVVRMVRRRWSGCKITEIPDPAHVDLAFVIDGKVIEAEDEDV